MKLTDALIGEHSAFYTLFDGIEDIAATESATAIILGATAVLQAMVESHATLEDELLFDALEPHLGKDVGPLVVMRAEHEEMKHLLRGIDRSVDAGEAIDLVREALGAARAHFQKEEQALFPMAQRLLGDDELTRLGSVWARARRVTIEE